MSLLNAFLDGVTATGLFGKRSWPGAPTELIDSRTPAQFNASEAALKLLQARRRSERITPQVDLNSSVGLHPGSKD